MDSGVGELGGGIVGAGASEAGACEITRLLLSEIFFGLLPRNAKTLP
jgi:hypothetical protein